eukprot:16271147-Heterocapsa_arctica.AAC.1
MMKKKMRQPSSSSWEGVQDPQPAPWHRHHRHLCRRTDRQGGRPAGRSPGPAESASIPSTPPG